MKSVHAMPFGAEASSSGVRFRLWAPGAGRVTLRLEDRELPMPAQQGGWFGVTVDGARPGKRYAFRIDDGAPVPDPASRCNPDDVHGASEVIDPAAFVWSDESWRGRRWEEAVIYELHVGSFTPEGNFAGVATRLEYLAALGVTAVELMPVADFPGRRNWGYDGVLLFAPDHRYGRPEDLKQLVAKAHELGLMVLLDVVYNHFGPSGNYLPGYAATFFTDRHATPWGAAIDFEGNRTVRDFFVHNALYWLEEYHLDGLRLDAIHAIYDASSPDIVEAIAAAVRDGPGRDRQVHLVLENDRNQARYLGRSGSGDAACASAQWNDDFHHALHVLLTGEHDGYYADYAAAPLPQLGRCLAEGFAFQGEVSAYRGGKARGEVSTDLPPAAFVAFLQNHDQVGNRAFGERLNHLAEPAALAAAVAILLLAPAPPMLFMGEEFGCPQPFLFFCDFAETEPELAAAVTAGRRNEFARFARFADPAVRAVIPDPNAEATFRSSCLDWASLATPAGRGCLARYRELLALRREQIVPRLAGMRGADAQFEAPGDGVLAVGWRLGDGSRLSLLANLGVKVAPRCGPPPGEAIHLCNLNAPDLAAGRLPPWSVAWFLAPAA